MFKDTRPIANQSHISPLSPPCHPRQGLDTHDSFPPLPSYSSVPTHPRTRLYKRSVQVRK